MRPLPPWVRIPRGALILPNVKDEPRSRLARAVLLGARIVTAVIVGSGALLGRLFSTGLKNGGCGPIRPTQPAPVSQIGDQALIQPRQSDSEAS